MVEHDMNHPVSLHRVTQTTQFLFWNQNSTILRLPQSKHWPYLAAIMQRELPILAVGSMLVGGVPGSTDTGLVTGS